MDDIEDFQAKFAELESDNELLNSIRKSQASYIEKQRRDIANLKSNNIYMVEKIDSLKKEHKLMKDFIESMINNCSDPQCMTASSYLKPVMEGFSKGSVVEGE